MPKSRVVCSYRGCTNNKNYAPDKDFFKILKDSCRLWLELIGRAYLFCKPDHVIHNSTRIFADHFPESCFNSTLCPKLRHCVCPRISGFRLPNTLGPIVGQRKPSLNVREDEPSISITYVSRKAFRTQPVLQQR